MGVRLLSGAWCGCWSISRAAGYRRWFAGGTCAGLVVAESWYRSGFSNAYCAGDVPCQHSADIGSSARNHFRLGNVDLTIVRSLAPGVVIGGLGGSFVAELVPSSMLPKIFAIIVLLLATQMLLSMRFSGKHDLPGSLGTFCSGGVIGVVSSLAGIGGGSLTVPYLNWHGVEMRRAIGCASFSGALIAIAGMTGFVLAGVREQALPPMSLGYVYLPALLGIVLVSMQTTRFGAAWVSHLPTPVLKKIFAIFFTVCQYQNVYGVVIIGKLPVKYRDKIDEPRLFNVSEY